MHKQIQNLKVSNNIVAWLTEIRYIKFEIWKLMLEWENLGSDFLLEVENWFGG